MDISIIVEKTFGFLKKQKTLSVDVILKTHKLGMKTRDTLEEKDKGKFRTFPVWIGGHEAKDWHLIPSLMAQWIDNANNTVAFLEGKKDAEEEIKQDHIAFEAIHPFGDFNGRIGRLLLNYQRVKTGLPILIIYKDKRWEYYGWFN